MTATPIETALPDAVEAQPPRPEEAGNVDALTQSTARMTRPAWDCFLKVRADWEAVCHTRFRFALQASDAHAATEIATALEAVHVTALKQEGNLLRFLTSFAKVQAVIKHPHLRLLDATDAFGVYN